MNQSVGFLVPAFPYHMDQLNPRIAVGIPEFDQQLPKQGGVAAEALHNALIIVDKAERFVH